MPDDHYATDVDDAAWALLAPLLPAAQPGGRPRTTDIRAVINAIFYLLRTGCQWRLLPRDFQHVLATSLIASSVIGKVSRIKAQLFGDEGAHLCRWLLALLKYPSGKIVDSRA